MMHTAVYDKNVKKWRVMNNSTKWMSKESFYTKKSAKHAMKRGWFEVVADNVYEGD